MKRVTNKPMIRKRANHFYSPFDRMLEEWMNIDAEPFFKGMTHRHPAVNILETEDAYQLEFAAPGRRKEDFTVELHEGVLKIAGGQPTVKEETTENYRRREFRYVAFERQFQLPETVNEDSIKATYENGILTVHIQKAEEQKAKAPKVIDIA